MLNLTFCSQVFFDQSLQSLPRTKNKQKNKTKKTVQQLVQTEGKQHNNKSNNNKISCLSVLPGHLPHQSACIPDHDLSQRFI